MPRMGLEWETQRLGDAGVIEGKMQVCPVRSFVTSSKWDFHGQGGWSMKGTWYAGVSKKICAKNVLCCYCTCTYSAV